MTKHQVIIGITGASVIGIGILFPAVKPTEAAKPVVEVQTPIADTSKTSKYKDGKFKGSYEYYSPGGTEEIIVELVLKDSIVTDVACINKSDNTVSEFYQEEFQKGCQEVVVGKSLDELDYVVVSGSTLTNIGFYSAVYDLKTKAQN